MLKEGDRPVALHVQLAATENNNFVEESEEETADHGLNKDLQEDQDDNDDIPISLAVLLNEESVTDEQLLREDQEEAPATLPVQIEKTIMDDLEAPSVQQSSNKTSCKLINTKTGKGISDKSVNENEEICQTNVTESTKSQKATNQGPVLSNCSMETHVIESTGNQKTKKQVSLLKCSISLRLQTILGDKKSLYTFDSYREQLKHNSNDRVIISAYEESLAIIQMEVLKEMTKLRKKLSDWEKQFFIDKLKEPDTEEIMKSVMKDTFEKLQLCKKYLRHWKISI